ncbi:sigma-70 family RNA polymerase sigma factor [Nocardioides carbamazepini]|uniref:sigma-70 family RNA polymerase sigma factor n=1 Tax=Nocardioides carbamazepini TaxID=2854259 RepID=UPI002149D2BE|nr:sigma-70 family RNA polymerase sigma factor [Nocardioides carbamazepini]MCR1786424.1 sigma-70 family RNA polymerase sigma factor [Nocardioides carbamazepini]
MDDDASRTPEEELLGRVRAGETGAFEELYRDHVDGARHLARILVGTDAAEELVAESFSRVLGQLSSGGGPTSSFRSYLHVTIRNGYRDGLRSRRESVASDQPWLFEQAETAEVTPEEAVEALDETVAVDALASLPESWRRVLWHVEVEGRKPAEVATLMDLKPRAVSSLAHRAREGLKRAYLDLHAGPEPVREQCRWVHNRMSQHARGDLGTRAEQRFDAHLDGCADCQRAFLVVDRVNQKLAVYLLPIVLLALPVGGKGVAWLAGGTAAGAAGAAGSTSGGGAGGASGAAGAAAGGASGPVVAVAAAVVVAAVAAGAFAAIKHDGTAERAPAASRPAAGSAPAGAAASDPGPAAPAGADPVPAGPAPAEATPVEPATPTQSAAAPSAPPPAKDPGKSPNDPGKGPGKDPADDSPKGPAGVPAGPAQAEDPAPPVTPPPDDGPPPKKPGPADCGERRICAGPVTITLPGNGQHGASVEIDLLGLPITISIGPKGGRG